MTLNIYNVSFDNIHVMTHQWVGQHPSWTQTVGTVR